MSSADYQAYVQSEIEECKRRANVYQGAIADSDPAAEHLSIDHLDKLLSGPLTQDLKTLYMKEYDEIRASIRAIALVSMTRKDFYDNASHEMRNDRERLATSAATNRYFATRYKKDAPDDFVTQLDADELEYQNRKNEVVDRIRASNDSSTATLSDADIIKQAMRATGGVNNKGVSTSAKEIS